MSKSDTHTVETRFGPTEIETVECASCETKVAKDSAVPFQMGDPIGTTGYACEVCADTGPAGFPEQVVEWALPRENPKDSDAPGFGVMVVLAPFLLPLITMVGFRNGDQFVQGYAQAVVTILLWGGAIALGWYL